MTYEVGRKDRALCERCGFTARLENGRYVEHGIRGERCSGSGEKVVP